MRHYFYLLILTLLSFISCETELPEGTWSKEPPTPSVTYQLSIDKTTIVAKTEGSSEAFNITSDDSWTISTSETWIKVSDTTGAGDKTITVTVEANTGKDARSGTITVKGKSSGSKSISVSQSGKEYSLSVDKTKITVSGSSGSSETFTITSDDSWTATSDVSWATLSATSGSGDKTITVSISLNSTTTARSGNITVKGSNSGISKTISVTQSGKSSLDTNGHEYVDLGLPSGLLWATCNVGASKPEDYGDYFAWGETTTKSTYDWSTYKYCKGSFDTLTKYNNESSYGPVDNKTVLDPEDDAAHVNWGGSWRMPTRAELSELLDTKNCTWKRTTQNGVNGYKVKSKKNGNSLFLPAVGCRLDSSLYDAGLYGNYWSSSLYLYSYDPSTACILNFYTVAWGPISRYFGLSVRPVCESLE